MRVPRTTMKRWIKSINMDIEVKYGLKSEITHIYSNTSRVIRPGYNSIAVKLKDGRKGWLNSQDLTFTTEQDLKEGILRALDESWNNIGQFGEKIEDLYDRMSPRQKALFNDAISGLDWDGYWEGVYRADDYDTQERFYDSVREIAKEILSNRFVHG